MTSNLSVQTAIATLKVIEYYLPTDFDTLGITEEEFHLVHGSTAWRRDHMPRIVRTMLSLIFGALEQMSLPKMIVPAEYVAAVISAIVHPANAMACCIILSQERQTGVGALELAARGATPSGVDPTSADQLFALVCILNDTSESNTARKRLRDKLGIRIEKALKGIQ